MPRTPTNYQGTIMYKVVCNDLKITECYIGHTTNFINRKRCHKSDCNNEKRINYNLKIYQFIRENGGWENWCMVEIEKFPCNDGNEARARERYWYEQLQANLNTKVPNRDVKEYLELNRESLNEKQRKRNEERRDIINERSRKRYEEHKDIINEQRRQKRKDKKSKIVC